MIKTSHRIFISILAVLNFFFAVYMIWRSDAFASVSDKYSNGESSFNIVFYTIIVWLFFGIIIYISRNNAVKK